MNLLGFASSSFVLSLRSRDSTCNSQKPEDRQITYFIRKRTIENKKHKFEYSLTFFLASCQQYFSSQQKNHRLMNSQSDLLNSSNEQERKYEYIKPSIFSKVLQQCQQQWFSRPLQKKSTKNSQIHWFRDSYCQCTEQLKGKRKIK